MSEAPRGQASRPGEVGAAPDRRSGRAAARVIPLRSRLLALPNVLPIPVRFDPSETILLAGSSRSGTTWLAQVLATSPRLALLTEPFNPKNPGVARAGFTWRTHCDPEVDWSEGERFMARVWSGRGMSLKLVHRNRWKLFRARRLLVKAVRVNRLLPFITHRFSLGGIVLLIRHPCAVVSSQMKHFRLTDLAREDDLSYVDRHLPSVSGWARSLETEAERRALTWALDQRAALGVRGAVHVLSYERMVLDGVAELRRLAKSLDVDIPSDAELELDQPSWQARSGSVDHATASADERLGVWRDRLGEDQARRILDVVAEVGVRGFGYGIEPEGDRLGVENTGGSR